MNLTNLNPSKEYGLVFYDVPQVNQLKVYYKIMRVINTSCLPINKSVYIFDYSLKNVIETKLNKCGAFQLANINLVKFDKASSEELEKMALASMNMLFGNVKENLTYTVAELGDNNNEKKEVYLDRISKKLQDFEGLLTIYEFTKCLEGALTVLKNTITEEYKKIKGTVNV